jgi:prepilin signal peptidase PulO-like enzyme (type II secretory pathway)
MLTLVSIFFIFIFLIGLFFGSFLNVLIDRLPIGESILGRSHCEKCKHVLSWKDLIPLISFIYLKGKCRYCHTTLSYQYPLMELFTGIMFIFTFQFMLTNTVVFNSGFLISLIFNLSIVSGLIVILFADLKYKIIPDEILIFLGVVISVWLLLFNQNMIINHLLSGLGSFLFFLSIFLITRGRGMGFGDVKFAFILGLLLGFPQTALALYIAFLTGGIIGIILILWKKKRMKSEIAFGPFLVLGTFASFFFSPLLLPRIMALLS